MALWIEKLRASVIENPFAWVFFVLFLIAEFGNYSNGMDIQRICELTGYHDGAVVPPRTDREELDNICIDHQP